MNASITQTYKNHNFHYGWEYMIQQEGNSTLARLVECRIPAVGANGNYTSKCGTASPAVRRAAVAGAPIADFIWGFAGTGSTMPISATFLFAALYRVLLPGRLEIYVQVTLNLGLRWDYERPTTERFNRFFSQYNPTAPQTVATAAALSGYTADYGGSSAGSVLLQTWGSSLAHSR